MFKNRILIVDADTKISAKAAKRGNSVKLPCPAGVTGTGRSPENVIIAFVRELSRATDASARGLLLRLQVVNPSSDKVTAKFFPNGTEISTKREATKAWWQANFSDLKRWGILDLWVESNQSIVDSFIEEFERAVQKTSTKLR